jgi:putative endonuclease
VFKLVWYQEFQWIVGALKREKQIKAGSRRKKIEPVETLNPGWKDLYDELDG